MMEAEALKTIKTLYEEAAHNSLDHRVYYQLGKYYEKEGNKNRAYLCYGHSYFLCDDKEEQLFLEKRLTDWKSSSENPVPSVSLIIPALTSLEQMKAVIAACLLRKEDSSRVIVLDWEESKEVTDWILEQKDLTVVSVKGENLHNAYEKAAEKADKNDDLLLLDRGAALLSHALFHLRMSLYKSNDIGAVNAVTNGPAQGLTEYETPIKRADGYAVEHSLPGDERMDPVLLPSCKTLLVKREFWEETGGLDGSFLTLETAQKDYCFQLLQLRKLTYLCHHGYVYTLIQPNNSSFQWFDSDYFHKKWDVRLNYSLFARPEILRLIDEPAEASLRILDVGCACGASLLSMKKKFPHAKLYGIELDPGSWNIASKIFPVTQGNVEGDLDYPEKFFDYIIFGDVLEHLHQPEEVLINMKRYLKSGGRIIASIPNIMHISVLADLLNGHFTYQESGILDRTHLRFFTKAEIVKMFSRAGYEIKDIGNTRAYMTKDQENLVKTLCDISKSPANEFEAYQYLVKAEKL